MDRGDVCPLPFTQLFLNPNGKVSPCCYLAQEPFYYVGDIREQSLEEIWNSEKLRALRRELLSGKPKTCANQMGISKCHLIRKDLLDHAVLKETVPFPMVRLDLMLNGKCNLECVMCGVWPQPNGVYTENGFWEQGRESIFPYLAEIDAKGGEPFIQKDIFRLIDQVSAVNPECNWHFTTNGHYRFNEKLRSAVSKIKIVRLSVSIDSLDPECFARIRKKGDLSLVLKTLDDWIAYRNSARHRLYQINCNFVVQQANWREVPAFFAFCRSREIVPFLIILTNPDRFSILQMPVEERIELVEIYFEAMKTERERTYYRLIRPVLDTIPGAESAGLRRGNSETLREMDAFAPSIAEVEV